MRIRPCAPDDVDEWADMRVALWPDEHESTLRAEAVRMAAEPDPDLLNLVAVSESGEAVGFAEASIRRDYVNGCETTPVAFLEALYVAPCHRLKGVARGLIEAVEAWGRGKGCSELGSDALLDNLASHRMHAAVGFQETERVVYFRRNIRA